MTISRISDELLASILSFAGHTQEKVCRRFKRVSRLVCREMVDVYRVSPLLGPQIPTHVDLNSSDSLVTRLFRKVFCACKGTAAEGVLRQTPLAIGCAAEQSVDYNLDIFFSYI